MRRVVFFVVCSLAAAIVLYWASNAPAIESAVNP